MIIYIVFYTVCITLIWVSEKVKKRQKKYVAFIAIISLCMLGAFRASGIGTDTSGYLIPLCKNAISAHSYMDFLDSSWISGFSTKTAAQFEIGFSLLIYILMKLTGSIVIVQFVLQLLIILPIYYVINKRKEIPNWIGILIYCFWINNPSYNLIRQAVALSLGFLAYHLWCVEEKRKLGVVSIIMAYFFHNSSLLYIPIIFIHDYICGNSYKIIKSNKTVKSKNVKEKALICLIVGSIAFLGINTLFVLLKYIGFAKYSGYLLGTMQFMPNQIIARLPIIVLICYYFIKYRPRDNEAVFLSLMIYYDLLITQLVSIYSNSLRIGIYFESFLIILLPQILYYKKKRYLICLTIAYIIIYWLYFICIVGTHQTVPYSTLF